MYSAPTLALKYLQYYFKASNGKGHGMHSPFVFDFIAKVLCDKQHYTEYDKVEELRQQLLSNKTPLVIKDLGAGSSKTKSDTRSIASLAKNAAKPKKFGQLLFRLVKYYQPKIILELGTSLGITTSYLSLAKPDRWVITAEGSGEIAEIARKNFKELSLSNVELVEGNFDNVLPGILNNSGMIDFAFIDGNHRKEPTLRYFKQIQSKSGNDTILIFDDIHWSREMEEAWKIIKDHPATSCTIDLFFIGIVLFRKEFHEKQHFSIRF
ncbi:MAG TPA: class I SAM-dependent methyltransferase [Chitinophagaceae bacterium]|nr:class I SAM-dependent methyltransferase [Chitinophagaceae bacterium]